MARTASLRCVAGALILSASVGASLAHDLTFEERLKAQEAIERVYWTHRTWPKENPGPKPALASVMPAEAIHAKVEEYLKKSNALEDLWNAPITGDQLQAEMSRMAARTRDPQLLQELFHALGEDRSLIAECLARPVLADRMLRRLYSETVPATIRSASYDDDNRQESSFDSWWSERRVSISRELHAPVHEYALASVGGQACTADTWTPMSRTVEERLDRVASAAVWTGSELIVWGGFWNTGERYDPATDTWTSLRVSRRTPHWRVRSSAVWTGTEMIVWGGEFYTRHKTVRMSSGGRYDPMTDTWRPTRTGGRTPERRSGHTAVWTGTEMFIWGGYEYDSRRQRFVSLNTGARYNPEKNAWRPMSTGPNAPGRSDARAIWTGSEMIVWGGFGSGPVGGRYDPTADVWQPVNAGPDAPAGLQYPSCIWTGNEMIVWGGGSNGGTFNTGGRYNPTTDIWVPTSIDGAPAARRAHSAVWTGSEMIVWGGEDSESFNTGGRYNPMTDSWTEMAVTEDTPSPRFLHTVAITGHEMLIWGGANVEDSGGLYCYEP